MRDVLFLVVYGLAVAFFIWAKVIEWRSNRRIEAMKAKQAARALRMEARLVVCRDRYYTGRTAAAVNGFGRALAREAWDLAQ